MVLKEFKALRDFSTCGIEFKKDEIFYANVIQYGIAGGFDRFAYDSPPTMEGSLNWFALCETSQGSVFYVEIGFNANIIRTVK